MIYETLYVFGDSHATPDEWCPKKDSFWGLAAKDIGFQNIMNYAHPGCAYESIRHAIICLLQEGQFTQDDILFIGIPVLERFSSMVPWTTTVDDVNWAEKAALYTGDLELVQEFKPPELSRIINVGLTDKRVAGEFILGHDRQWWEISAMRETYLLTTLLDNHNINYVFINLAHRWTLGLEKHIIGTMFKELSQSNRHILFNDTLNSINDGIHKPVDFKQYGYTGHHGPAGNKRFYDLSLKPRLERLGIL